MTKTPDRRRRYCPGCRRTTRDREVRLCERCGDTILDQTFCPVCEDYWSLPVGKPCPKHEEIELVDRLPELKYQVDPSTVREWSRVAAVPDWMHAQMIRLTLEADGIPTILVDAHMGSGEYRLVTGGIKIKVPSELAEEARTILGTTPGLTDDRTKDEPARFPMSRFVIVMLLAGALAWAIVAGR